MNDTKQTMHDTLAALMPGLQARYPQYEWRMDPSPAWHRFGGTALRGTQGDKEWHLHFLSLSAKPAVTFDEGLGSDSTLITEMSIEAVAEFMDAVLARLAATEALIPRLIEAGFGDHPDEWERVAYTLTYTGENCDGVADWEISEAYAAEGYSVESTLGWYVQTGDADDADDLIIVMNAMNAAAEALNQSIHRQRAAQ